MKKIELNFDFFSLYIQFLANYLPEPLSDFTDLCLDLGSIIVERSTILPAILPGSLCKTDPRTADETYACLLGLFVHYMRRVRQPHPAPVFAVDNQVNLSSIFFSRYL
jgi:hypothetical protein